MAVYPSPWPTTGWNTGNCEGEILEQTEPLVAYGWGVQAAVRHP